MTRRLLLVVVLGILAISASDAVALDAGDEDAGVVVVADVSGPLDQRALDFVVEALATPDAQMVILQLDSPGLSSGDDADVRRAIEASPVPVAAWLGPAGATAYGPAGRWLLFTDVSAAAPGASVGFLGRDRVGTPVASREGEGYDFETLGADRVEITAEGPNPAVIDEVTPTIGQFIIGLDGRTIETMTGPVTLETARTVITNDDGIENLVPSVEVRFLKPGLFTRFLRLASRPEATFFFMLVGLAAIAFEFYAAGVGVTAAVGALSLFVAGYGFATLPISWFGVALALLGVLAYTIELQRNQLGALSLAGSALLVWGGLVFTNTGPEYPPRWWAVLLTVIGFALFYAFAITTVVRARFSTRTIGREQLIGRSGVAETGFDPMGVVIVDGARWQARSHRAAGLTPGDPIEVLEVKGIMLEVGPPSPADLSRGVRD